MLLIGACSGGGQGEAGEPTLTPQQVRGNQLFDQYCESCHARSGDVVVVGPSLAGVSETAADRVDGMDARTYLEQSITNPSSHIVEGYDDLMPPGLSDSLSQEEIDALIAYLLTLE